MLKKIFILLIFSSNALAKSQPENVIYSDFCKKGYHETYKKLPTPKAFSYSRDKTGRDLCNWSYGGSNIEKLKKDTMKLCTDSVMTSPCHIIDINGKFIAKKGQYSYITAPDNTPLNEKEVTALIKKAKPTIIGNCFPFFKNYLKDKGHKSFSYSLDANGNYACGKSFGSMTEKMSQKATIQSCKENKLKRAKKAPMNSCKIYAIGNKIIAKEGIFPKYKAPDNTPLSPKEKTALLQKTNKIINGNCAPFFEKYLDYDGYKAFSYAQDNDGKLSCGQQVQQSTQKQANEAAMNFCNNDRSKFQLQSPCKLFAKGNKVLLSSKDYEIKQKQKAPLVKSNNTIGTFIVYKNYNALAQRAVNKTAKVLNHKIRTENNYNPDKKYTIIDSYVEMKYFVTPDNTLKSQLNEKSSYNNKAAFLKVSKGHYIYSAADLACNHIYIKPYENKDMRTFSKVLTMIPTKIKGMRVSRDEKKCQKAARDAAKKARDLGQVIKITDSNNKEVFFEIISTEKKKFDKALFSTGKESQSINEMLKQSMETAMQGAVYNKLIKFIDKTDKLSNERKNTIKKEAKKAFNNGSIMEYMKKLNKMNPNKN